MNQNEKSEKQTTPYFLIKIILTVGLFLALFYYPSLVEKKWLHQFVNGAWTFLLPSLVVSFLRLIIISLYNARHGKKTVRGNFVLGINQLTVVLNVVFFILALIVCFGINPIEFLTSMTIVAMAVAVIFREYITNMLSGLFIMFSDQLSVGDRIKIGNEEGKVKDINLSNIVLKNDDDDMVMVPNNFFYTQPVTNLSVNRSEFFYVKFELPLSITNHFNELKKDLQNFLLSIPELEKPEESKLLVEEIGREYVKFKIELNAITSSHRIHRKIEDEILKQIVRFYSLLNDNKGHQ